MRFRITQNDEPPVEAVVHNTFGEDDVMTFLENADSDLFEALQRPGGKLLIERID